MNPLYYPTKPEIRQIVRAFERMAEAYHQHACQNGGKGGGSAPHTGKFDAPKLTKEGWNGN